MVDGMHTGIGWDIGIKNLAYCILEPTQNNTQRDTQRDIFIFNTSYYAIAKWADISLVKQIESNLQNAGEVSHINTVMKCAMPKTDKLNAPICGINAFYCNEQLNTDGTYKGYCKKHFKKSGITKMPELTVKKCYVDGCVGKTSQVLKTHIYTSYCKHHITALINDGTKQRDDFLKLNRAKTTSKIDINHLGVALFQELDKIKIDILAPNIILLENQPVLKNPTMKSMQMFLYSYYLIRHMDIPNTLEHKNLQCYTASKKLDLIKFFTQPEQTKIQSILENVKNNYQKNKKMAVMMVEVLLKDNVKWLTFFKQHPKQDDLADSLLMTLHYFEKHNLVKLNKEAKKKIIKDNTTKDNTTKDNTTDNTKSNKATNIQLQT